MSYKNCYRISAKAGHVGGDRKFILVDFYVLAEDGKEAAEIVRNTPRVKHDHKDAIREVTKISYAEYLQGQQIMSEDPYLHCKNIQEQRMHMDEIAPRIQEEEPAISYKYKTPRRNAKRALRYGYGEPLRDDDDEFFADFDSDDESFCA